MILALETSGKAASAALFDPDNKKLIAQVFENRGLTHSQTLMPMTDMLLKTTGTELSRISLIAVSAGPGSFTGLRIGISAAKGLAMGGEIPAVGVSTLLALAFQAGFFSGIVCCALDARREQVYTALFDGEAESPKRLTEDAALSFSDVRESLLRIDGREVLLTGDGAELLFEYLLENGVRARLISPHLRFQSAVGVALAAARAENRLSAAPVYLRLPQAERERLLRESRRE